MSKRKHLIVGCGSAGLSALKQIRKLGSDDEVKLVTMEHHPPYSPMSIPYLISGRRKESEIFITGDDFFERMNATLVTGRRVDKIDSNHRRVRYDSGEEETYDTLLIATGSEPVRPRMKGSDDVGFLGVHTLDDFHELVDRLEESSVVTVLGAGLVGMEAAAALAERGSKVRVIEKEDLILPLYFDPPVGEYISNIFYDQGVQIVTGKEVTEVRRAGTGIEVVCTGGDIFPSDLILSCVGVASRLFMLDGSGIQTNNGILVDRRMRTNIDGIFAAGDVAEAPSFLAGENGVSFILPSAVDQGRVAGSNMIGEDDSYDGWIPLNAFNFFGHLAVSIGELDPFPSDDVLTEQDDEKKVYKKIMCRDNKLWGATFFNVDVDAGVLQYLMRNRVEVGPHQELLLKQPRNAGLWLMLEAEAADTRALVS